MSSLHVGVPRVRGVVVLAALAALSGGDRAWAGTETDLVTYYGVNAGPVNSGWYNSFFGAGAGQSNTSGGYNTFSGYRAGFSNTTGGYLTFTGAETGKSNTTGLYDTFNGFRAGYSNTSGDYNSFFGTQAGYLNTTGRLNTFLGARAGYSNTNGDGNTFSGYTAGYINTTGSYNTFSGYRAGFYNTTGASNTFAGVSSGESNVTGSENAFFGFNAGSFNTTAWYNSFFGSQAGAINTSGSYNTFSGYYAGRVNSTGYYNTFNGAQAGRLNSTGISNTFVGRASGYNSTTGDNNTFVGHAAGESNTTGNSNTSLGAHADVSAGIFNATAIGFQAKVSQSNSMVLGAIPNLNTPSGANSYVAVGMGTDQPAAPLHVKRDVEGTSEMLLLENVSPTVANRVMIEMVNNGGTSINFTHSGTGQTWTLRAGANGANVFDLYRVGGANLVRVTGAGNMTLKGTLTQNSNVHDKTGIVAVDAQALLGQVERLPISRWSYQGDEGSAHVGPMAQDFHASFGLGDDETKIAPGDMAGVALAAIQALQARLASQHEDIATLKTENAALREQVLGLLRTIEERLGERTQNLAALKH